MKKLFCVITALVMSIMMMGCATCSDMSWARVEPVGETGTYLFVSQDGDTCLFPRMGTLTSTKRMARLSLRRVIFGKMPSTLFSTMALHMSIVEVS